MANIQRMTEIYREVISVIHQLVPGTSTEVWDRTFTNAASEGKPGQRAATAFAGNRMIMEAKTMEMKLKLQPDERLSELPPGTYEVELVEVETDRLTFALVDPKTNEHAKSWRDAVSPIRDVVEEMTVAADVGSSAFAADPKMLRRWIDKLNTVCP